MRAGKARIFVRKGQKLSHVNVFSIALLAKGRRPTAVRTIGR